MDLKKCVRVIEDFPKEGISFKDITTLLKDGKALKYAIDQIVEDLKDKNKLCFFMLARFIVKINSFIKQFDFFFPTLGFFDIKGDRTA